MMAKNSDEIVICFESSGGKASVAVSRGSVILAHQERVARHGHAAWMITLGRDVLDEAGLSPRDCTAVVAGRGPGSFTGIRVALAAAKGLGLGLSCPVFGLSSLDALAHVAADGVHPVAGCIDSRRGSIFTATYHPNGRPMAAIMDIAHDDLADQLHKTGKDWIITGSIGAISGINDLAPHGMIETEPDARHLSTLFSSLDDQAREDLPLEPIYLSAPFLGPQKP